MNKRGVSSIIATALLIGLVVVLSTIVFLWARGFISEQVEKFGTPIETQCNNINWNVDYVGNTGKTYSLAVSNNGNIPIYGIAIGMKNDGRKDIATFENIQIRAGDTVTKDFVLSEYEDFEELVVYPILLGQVVGKNENQMETCLDNGLSFKV